MILMQLFACNIRSFTAASPHVHPNLRLGTSESGQDTRTVQRERETDIVRMLSLRRKLCQEWQIIYFTYCSQSHLISDETSVREAKPYTAGQTGSQWQTQNLTEVGFSPEIAPLLSEAVSSFIPPRAVLWLGEGSIFSTGGNIICVLFTGCSGIAEQLRVQVSISLLLHWL